MALITGTPEHDFLIGTKNNDDVYGGATYDTIYAGAGDDMVYGEGGADYIGNDYGNDLLNGGAETDTITFGFLNQQDIDPDDFYPNATIGVKFDLAITTQQNLGAWGLDTILNFENVTGSLANDNLWGNDGANHIFGARGDDGMDGRAGNDTLIGGEGKDTLIGGAGADLLFGYAKGDSEWASVDHLRDTFRFVALAESGVTPATWDHIYGEFGGAATDDKISLQFIDANPNKAGDQAFKFVGNGPFTAAAGEVRTDDVGDHIRVWIDIDADANAEMILYVHDVASLSAADFIL